MARKGKEKTEAQKQADFVRLAEKHGNTILNGFRKLANLSNSNKYASTPAIRKRLQEAIEEAGATTFDALEGKKTVSTGLKLS